MMSCFRKIFGKSGSIDLQPISDNVSGLKYISTNFDDYTNAPPPNRSTPPPQNGIIDKNITKVKAPAPPRPPTPEKKKPKAPKSNSKNQLKEKKMSSEYEKLPAVHKTNKTSTGITPTIKPSAIPTPTTKTSTKKTLEKQQPSHNTNENVPSNDTIKTTTPISERVRRKKPKQCVKVNGEELQVHVDLHNQKLNINENQKSSQKTTPIEQNINSKTKKKENIDKTNNNVTEAVNTLNVSSLQVNTSPKAPKTPRSHRKQMVKTNDEEIHSVSDKVKLQKKKSSDVLDAGNSDDPNTIEADKIGAVNINSKEKLKENVRKPGIISDRIEQKADDINIDFLEKPSAASELIRKAIKNNDFLNNMMDNERLEIVINAMKPQTLAENSFVVNEGENGAHFYVSARGQFQVIKDGEIKTTFGPGVVFGELAILYKAKRFASIKVTTEGMVWALERKIFQKIMMKTGSQEREQNIKFLQTVKVLEGLPTSTLHKVADLLKREFYATNTTIIRQGDPGDKFYIIRGGSVSVLKKSGNSPQPKKVGELFRGKYFGEQALIKEDKRLASIIANEPGTECLTLDRVAFINYLGNITDLNKEPPNDAVEIPTIRDEIKSEFDHIQLDDLEIVGTLGVGGFGRVELVQYKKKETFALKILKKYEVANQGQIEHAYSEKQIMAVCDSSFIVKLYKTYRNNKYLYFLMEACLGGDVWTQLQKTKFFDEKTSKFVTACVVEAFDYLHSRNIIYRDLKPENLMLDSNGYVKLVDFGFAKRINPNSKTWTFAGTPEYVAPEIILNKGHDRAVDYWALGVFVHELLIGKPPFRGKDHMKTYNLILRGIDGVQMPSKIPKTAQNLIKGLCKQIPTDRLGYQKRGITDIKKHAWFENFDWEKLKNKTLAAPLKRPVKSNTDLSNFDEYPRDRDDPPDENSGWDVHF